MSIQVARSLLAYILEQVPTYRPLPYEILQSIVRRTVTGNPSKTTSGWDACLRREIIGVAVRIITMLAIDLQRLKFSTHPVEPEGPGGRPT